MSLEAFTDRDVVTRRVTRATDAASFESIQRRIEDGLEWGVGGLVEDDDGRVLFVREGDSYEDATWKLPGGGVEAGESRAEALVREIREETGVTVAVEELLAVSEITVAHGDRSAQFHFGTYRATPETTTLTDDPGLADEGIVEVTWTDAIPESALDAALLRRVR
ncbi:NUDIX hydrolase [Haloarcula halophila]|uniref:NUDIX hydrolase n=1 Tax=Haloarcula TaxID=2237 RepID=UPI0023E47315|nr:NUDIX hydrolase [Halomicroarcula sp. DFY41]